jgi:hypothetical protein
MTVTYVEFGVAHDDCNGECGPIAHDEVLQVFSTEAEADMWVASNDGEFRILRREMVSNCDCGCR